MQCAPSFFRGFFSCSKKTPCSNQKKTQRHFVKTVISFALFFVKAEETKKHGGKNGNKTTDTPNDQSIDHPADRLNNRLAEKRAEGGRTSRPGKAPNPSARARAGGKGRGGGDLLHLLNALLEALDLLRVQAPGENHPVPAGPGSHLST